VLPSASGDITSPCEWYIPLVGKLKADILADGFAKRNFKV
jgi:hypothetical protein